MLYNNELSEITFRHGSCIASVFQNEYARGDERFAVRTVSFQRSYRDRGGDWQTSSNLRANDIPRAVLVLNKAFEYMTSNGHLEVEEEVEA